MVEIVSEKVKEYKEKYAHLFKDNKGKEQLIFILKNIQSKEGYLPRHALIAISSSLDVPLAHVYGVATFYNFFKLEPQGKYVIAICEGTACHIQGAPDLLKIIKNKIGISAGEMTQDKKFSVEIIRCLGLCAFAPVMLINEKQYTGVNEEKLNKVLDELINTKMEN